MFNAIEVGPGYGVNGLGLVEVEPGYGVDGLGSPMYGDDGVTLVGATMGAYDDLGALPMYGADGVMLLGALGDEEKPFFKRPMFWGGVAGFVATAASAYLLGKAMAFRG